jgi:polyhydroxyalkanoate synthesis regulator phasin
MPERTSRASSRARPASRSRSRGRSALPSANVAAVRDVVMKTVLAPINAVLLTRRHIEEVVDDAVRRGRMTRDDAQQMLQTLLQRGAKQTDDFLADLERLLGRGRGLQEQSPRPSRAQRTRASRTRRPSANLPITEYDELSAAAVQERLDGLTPAELRKLRDYERRHANRKTVLDPIEKRLR